MDHSAIALRALATAPRPRAEVGGKALQLARLLAAGLPIPPGGVLLADARDRDIDKNINALIEHAGGGTGPYAVRSSAAVEDGEEAAAPGLFASVLQVETVDLGDAVRRVRASADGPVAASYARARDVSPDAMRLAVIVQRQVGRPGGVSGTVYTRPPGAPDGLEMWVEAEQGDACWFAAIERDSGAPRYAHDGFPCQPERLAEIARLARAAERAIGASAGADVEWVIDAGAVWIVQARPIVHPPATRPVAPPALLAFSRAEPSLIWHWDAAHNPDPLSPAQAGLVERIDALALAPFRMRVVGGYLYVASEPDAATEGPPTSASALTTAFDERARPELERALSSAETAMTAPDAIAGYEAFYRAYAALVTPMVTAAKRRLPSLLGASLGRERADELAARLVRGAGHAPLDDALRAAADGAIDWDELVRRVGCMSPAWDVAVPTFAETPSLLSQAVERERARDREQARDDRDEAVREALAAVGEARAGELRETIELARAAQAIGEADDRLYARAQAAVRRALLQVAERWQLADPDDVFYLPLAMAIDSDEPPCPVAVHRIARAGRSARDRQQRWAMPLAFADGHPLDRPRRAGGSLWRGRGTGGRASGTVRRIADLAGVSADAEAQPRVTADTVLVVPTVTPALAVLVRGAAAVISAYGGALGHGASMARELGLPCVVDCPGAWGALRDGDAVVVDADAGVVVRRRG